MRNDVILLPSRLPSAEKVSNFHSQMLAAAPADGAMVHDPFCQCLLGISPSMIQTLERKERVCEREGLTQTEMLPGKKLG